MTEVVVDAPARLPRDGMVLGLDVGCSPSRRSSAICRLEWDAHTVRWSVERFRATDKERAAAISAMADRPALVVALDGPLRRGLDEIGAYRTAERLLTLGFAKRIGKPGQSSTPVGRLLNRNANACAHALVATGRVGPACHFHAIHETAIVEAFPTAFLGMLIAAPETLGARRSDRSDRFYVHLVESGGLKVLLDHLLPDRELEVSPAKLTNHDDRAALVCAITALAVGACAYVAVGDGQGWIILPPSATLQPWAVEQLRAHAARCEGGVDRVGPPGASEPW